MRLLIAFIAVPLIEIGLFIQVGDAIGPLANVAYRFIDRRCWNRAGAQSGHTGVTCAPKIVSGNERSNRALGTRGDDFICWGVTADTGVFHRCLRVFASLPAFPQPDHENDPLKT